HRARAVLLHRRAWRVGELHSSIERRRCARPLRRRQQCERTRVQPVGLVHDRGVCRDYRGRSRREPAHPAAARATRPRGRARPRSSGAAAADGIARRCAGQPLSLPDRAPRTRARIQSRGADNGRNSADADGVRGSRMKRPVCFVVASEMTVRVFLTTHLRAMQHHYELTVVVNTNNTRLLTELGVQGTLVPLRIERRVSPWRDLAALLALLAILRRGRFDIVHSMTPKAGLLAMTAAWLVRVPVRLHTFTGQVWVTSHGIARA